MIKFVLLNSFFIYLFLHLVYAYKEQNKNKNEKAYFTYEFTRNNYRVLYY